MACIRARCVAAWVFAQGKSGPGGKYWTSSCMYLPEGRVMPAYSTWHPVVGSNQPIASAAQTAIARLTPLPADAHPETPPVFTDLPPLFSDWLANAMTVQSTHLL